MRRTIARSIALAALVAGAAWAQQLTFTCTPAALPAVVGEVVSVTCDVPSGGIPPYTWSISPAHALPPRPSQDVTTGNITGTLAAPAVPYSFTVIATDNSTLDTGSQLYSGTTTDFTVTCTVATGPVEVFVLYSNSCTAAGGTPPYNWTIVGQTVPPGLTGGSITPNGNSATIAFTPLGPPAASDLNRGGRYTTIQLDNCRSDCATGSYRGLDYSQRELSHDRLHAFGSPSGLPIWRRGDRHQHSSLNEGPAVHRSDCAGRGHRYGFAAPGGSGQHLLAAVCRDGRSGFV